MTTLRHPHRYLVDASFWPQLGVMREWVDRGYDLFNRIIISTLSSLLFGVFLVDYVLLFQIASVSYTAGEGSVLQGSAWIIALVGVIAVLTWHALAIKYESLRFERAMTILAYVALVVFLIGASVMLGAIAWNGTDALQNSSVQEQIDIALGKTADQVESPAIQEWIRNWSTFVAAALFVLAMSSVFILTVYLSHRLTMDISARVLRYLGTRNTIRGVDYRIQKIQTFSQEHMANHDRREKLSFRLDQQDYRELEAVLRRKAEEGIRVAERMITIRRQGDTLSVFDKAKLSLQGVPSAVWQLDIAKLEAQRDDLQRCIDRLPQLFSGEAP